MAGGTSSWPRWCILLVHLAAWAELGVITRCFVDKLFTLGCSGGWGPCLTGGTYFSSLPANMLGSFIMGVFAASSTLGLANEKAMAVLPATNPWQSNFELQIGIRTGYCGSVTTLSSWIVEVVGAAIRHNSWVTGAVSLIVGLQAALVSYILGTHVALYVDRWVLTQAEDVLQEQQEYRAAEVRRYRGEVADDVAAMSPEQSALEELEQDLPRLTGKASPRDGPTGGVHDAQQAKQPRQLALSRTDFAGAAMLLVLTAGAAAGAGLETKRAWLREIWLAALLAPLGCILRWTLSRYNYQLGGSWAWFPGGTFAANMLGTGVAFALQCVVDRAGAGYWGSMLAQAAQAGFCGALTTVSTVVTEIVKFADVFPDSGHAYTYTGSTFLGGVLLGLVVYGWVGWT